MADIELVIKIPEEDFKRFGYEYSEEHCISKHTNETILNAFCNGTILPKGHGKLIDSQMLKRRFEYLLHHRGYKKNLIGTGINLAISETLDAPTIIEADKEVI